MKEDRETVKQQIMTMLEMQDAMNAKVNPLWREQGNAWYRAIWIECGELMDHYGWKWWKQQVPDREQVILELIDIWHFGLSILLETGRPANELANELSVILENSSNNQDLKEAVEEFTLTTLQTKSFDASLFGGLMIAIGLEFEDLYRGYVGKNVLNFFRQDNGYKDGTYKKVWQGREDNEHLVEAVQLLDSGSTTFKDDVYSALKLRYASA